MNYSVGRVYKVSDSLLQDCYSIVSPLRPDDAGYIYSCLRRDVEEKNHVLYVCRGADAMLGFIVGQSYWGGAAKIDWLFVDSRYRGNGIGQKLVAAYTDYCVENKFPEMVLFSAPNLRALHFWQRNGFERCGGNYHMRKSLQR